MRHVIAVTSALALASSLALAQEKPRQRATRDATPAPESVRPPDGRREVGGGHVPERAPARTPAGTPAGPPVRPASAVPRGTDAHGTRVAASSADRGRPPGFDDRPGHPNAPHYHALTSSWYGHGGRRDEDGLKFIRPWTRGHFEGEHGAHHVFRLEGGSAERFFFEGAYFSVALADVSYASDWRWKEDDVMLYDDPDHPGYYLAYNVRLGTYVHVEYQGR
ncbi:MAG: hypothetical protein HY275_13100 [Gemmatimonadetes bacterium]|nr:hypothetical protein [Gemmatimonadota bacterium]